MKRVLQTRMVGYTTHRSGHVMAPMDIVYECEEEPKTPWLTKRRMWMIGDTQRMISGTMLAIKNKKKKSGSKAK